MLAISLGFAIAGCASNPPQEPLCRLPEGHDLEQAFQDARFDLESGCKHRVDDYLQRLLKIAEGDPNKGNKARFSEFLVWAADAGLLSRRQATERYNRYFNAKFVSMMGDYSVCEQTCPDKSRVMTNMEQELADKELGLIKVSADPAEYQRANQLLRETELVLEATCMACGEQR